MKRVCPLLILLIFISVFHTTIFGQYRNKSNIRGGGGFGVFLSNGSGASAKSDGQFRLFFRHDLTHKIQGEFGLGAGRLSTGKSETNLLPVLDYRLLIQLYSSYKWYPYLYLGAGALYYSIQEAPAGEIENLNPGKWIGFFPAGVGVDINMGNSLAFGLNGGYNYTFSDDIDGIRSGSNDGFWSVLATLSIGGGFGEPDPDRDGLSSGLEKSIGTNPKNKDSDGDGMLDGEEYNLYLTNPLKPDTDDDALSDYDEIVVYGTNPGRTDSDADRLDDWEEVKTYGTDPNRPDSDKDRLSDYDEIVIYKSDPLDADMDRDELIDGDEVKYKTNINNPDSDADGLKDGEEVYTYKTNPLKADTDGGTVEDLREINRGSNPLDPSDDVILEVQTVGAKIVLEGVTFATNSANLTPESETVLRKALNTLLAYPEMVVEIQGYTDNTGSRAYNIQLSKRRAEAVRNWLIAQGINGERIVASGYGPDNPIAPNNTAEGRAKNRRIEFVRLK